MIAINPENIDIGVRSPLRLRKTLPGETGQAAEDKALINSVEKLGILQPPLLCGNRGDGPTAVFGHRRIAAAASCGIEKIPATFISECDTGKQRIISARIEEMKSGGQLSGLEKIIAVTKLTSFAGDETPGIINQLSQCYGRKLSGTYISKLAGLLELDSGTLEALHEGRVSTGDLIMLSEHLLLDPGQAVSLLKSENFSRGKQKEAIRLMLYLADQGKERWEKFLKSRVNSDRPLLESLRRACRPEMERDLRRIGEIISSLRLPSEASIVPPRNLEGDSFRLIIRLRDKPSLTKALSKLEKGLEDGKILNLLDILLGRD
ncbi:MAG: ParB N-terminal domain-containing protein [Candidatus Krumholzibacteriales bacterium]